MNTMEKYSAGFGVSFLITSLINTLLVIIKEKNAAVLAAMKSATGHHWITHGVLVLILIFILGFIFSGAKFGTTWGSKKDA